MTITKVYIVYYSLYGHVNTMAREVHKGAASIEGVEATLWRVPEILSDRILEKMKAPPKPDDVADIKPEQLVEADALIFGFPSRFGMMPSQLKAFFDATGELWASQALAGKPAGIFWSTGFNGGGQELSAWTAITQLAHHGMLYVPLGYTFGSGMFEMDEVKGGSAYGAGTFAGDGTRQPTELELQQAFYQGFMLSLQNRRVDDVFNDYDPELLIPGFTNLVPSSVLPNAAYSKDGGYEAYYNLARRINDTKGIIVNTFSDLEQYSIDALYDHDEKIPPIYAVGPLLDLKGQPNPKLDQSQLDLILRWLDKQPNKSVVFLCFGSMGVSFGPSQIREIALGLKHSGVRFLWAMKSPPRTNNYEEKRLPEGFLEWMELEGKGMICGWAPQVEVLAHKAIGGFVSHCGWNSILESMWFGVPILTWPIYAEQQLNAFRMVKELGLAVELRVDYRIGSKEIVMAEEIEKGLKNLMEKENILLKKVQEMARNAVLCGGSSFISVGKLINIMIGSN